MDFPVAATHDTALCLIPPRDQWSSVDRLRCDNDKAYTKWPPHVNLVYPFVKSTDPSALRLACDAIVDSLISRTTLGEAAALPIRLDSADYFQHKNGSTLFLCDKDVGRVSQIASLRADILAAIGQTRSGLYNMHMTVIQCEDTAPSSKLEFLLEKLRRLPPVSWNAGQLAVLVRTPSGQMKQWGLIDLASPSLQLCEDSFGLDQDTTATASPQQTWYISDHHPTWRPVDPVFSEPPSLTVKGSENLIVASWNVLAEFRWPPSRARYPIILDNLLAETSLADVVVLQEVTDDFLPYLLEDERIRKQYAYVSHGPPDNPAAGPLPNLLNNVVLSKYIFSWEYLPFKRQHKGSCVVRLDGLGHGESEGLSLPLILATCHLSQGLTDGAVVAKERELQRILSHLKSNYAANQWLIAGDFNIATSSCTVDNAVKKGSITVQTEAVLRRIEVTLAEAGLLDAWMVSRIEAGVTDNLKGNDNDIFEGEQGATFDPRENPHAAKMVGSGYNNRPQRYDRILVKSEGPLQISRFNMFGFIMGEGGPGEGPLYASDHWGIRCLLQRFDSRGAAVTSARVVPVQPKKAPAGLSDTAALRQCMENLEVFPTEQDETTRKEALQLLRQILLDSDQANADQTRGRPTVMLVPVGSYGLGTWSRTSDIDCLCIGSISPRIFFTLARQRLRKSGESGVRLLRKVKAKTGTMLEVEVMGIKCDLQYCQAPSVVDQWPDMLKRPPSDPAFSLPMQTLLKLKPARDLFYLQRSIPDLAQFRVSFQAIKTWAKSRGIYAAKFGYLGGIHLSVMLVKVCKMLLRVGGVVSAVDIITTFFDHYSRFDWQNDVVFDPFFHKNLRYHRTPREAMCLLGWHSPTLNTALIASVPTVKIISAELCHAATQLSGDGASWQSLLSIPDSSQDRNMTPSASKFLGSYRSFVNLRIHYWGASLERGSRLVGWLESRCASLLVDINRRVPELSARIWPARFVDSLTPEADETRGDYQGSYLIGLDWMNSDEKPSRDDLETAQSNLWAVLQQFEKLIVSDEKYFDPNTSWFSATVVKANELGNLQLDDREWGVYVDGDDESETEDEEEEEEEEGEDEEMQERFAEKTKKGKSIKQRSATSRKPEGAGKLRSALDVLNRLRWDPDMDSNDFLVGYEDRFLGPQEKALSAWKSEQTHEEFIPQHRILWFKRRSDDVIVWHRSERIDLLFKKT
ncbi:endonuclease/Exonuclease/phosphatase [Colletotrichum graminicola]|uniref:polynucleotide adenylyltransferase n=1 Tax=Colletotrichum graminicola (strain M1.001 / M2 / FGSC 10212) TaxID=645133 RepID=E3Q9K7_COLGM|nr:endonuclease/Exonuclease/phosphatase [Colletotrichum graminicola M1.001]EFQ27546.1 endonuclease/Exonuclease/phosphatase [Colletotrichum graminicola M1.001]WDK11818.1 endonuclease/Exonuclease/phosphatase [Colletotrichum graminicola]